MHVTWDGGSADVQFDRAADRGVKKKVPIGAVTTFVRFTAAAVDRGKYADLCLDDAIVFGSCSSDCDGTAAACAETLFVQLAVPQASTADTYDYPLTRKMLKGHPDLVGARVVEATRNGKRVMGAVVKNRCQADAIVHLASQWDILGATASCEKLALRREVWSVDAAMGTEPRDAPPPPRHAKPDVERECSNNFNCNAGEFCWTMMPGAQGYCRKNCPPGPNWMVNGTSGTCFLSCSKDSDCPKNQHCATDPPWAGECEP
jgi:hypothetical protein